jgi:1-acyl-sn-glycerol-3-phosphate acyltransferase
MLYDIAAFLLRIFVRVFLRVRITGIENVPRAGACIICFNHKSALDPPLTGCFIPRKMRFMAKKELFDIPVLGFLIERVGAFPVKREVGDITAIKNSIKFLQNGQVLAMYPEGSRSNTGNAKPGVALIAAKAQVPVIPVGISGKYRLFSELRINVGEPIHIDKHDGRLKLEILQEISDNIMGKIKLLAGEK